MNLALIAGARKVSNDWQTVSVHGFDNHLITFQVFQSSGTNCLRTRTLEWLLESIGTGESSPLVWYWSLDSIGQQGLPWKWNGAIGLGSMLEKIWCCWQSFHSSGLFFQSCCEKIFNYTYARPLIFTNERRIFAGDCWDQVPIGPTSTQLFWELSGRTGMHWRVQSWRVSQKRVLNWYSSSTCKCRHHGLHYSPCLGISKRLSILEAKNQVIFIP